MSADLQALLRDLATYLEQVQSTGSQFYLDEGPVEPLVTTAKAQVAEPTPAEKPRDTAFEAECATFVADALALIARTRGHLKSATQPTTAPQESMFATPAIPAPTTPESTTPHPTTLEAKSAALDVLANTIKSCTGCPLHDGRQNTVPGTGHPDAGLMLIGEAPGQEEDRQGLPFVGRSGQLLTDILAAIGFARDEVFIGNVLKCRPPGNRDPERTEVDACEPYLRAQIQAIQPRLILCLGRVAAQTLLGTTASLGSLRQSVHFFAGVPVMATYHPAALLRNPGFKRTTWDDVRKVRALHDALADAGNA